MNRNFPLLAAFLLFWLCASAESFYYDPHARIRILPEETNMAAVSVEKDSLEIFVDYSLGSILFQESSSLPGYYSVIMQGFGNVTESMLPDIPFRVDQFALPGNANGHIDIYVNIVETDTIPLKLLGATPPRAAVDRATFDPIPAPGQSTSLDPDSIVKLNYLGEKRGVPIVGVEISPIQYDADNGKVYIHKTFDYRIEYTCAAPRIKVVGDGLKQNHVWTCSYAVISTPELKPAIKDFVEWKRQCGYDMIEEYKTDWTHEKVMETIDSIYSENHIKYVLIVGDHYRVPGVPRRFDGWEYTPSRYVTDFPYSCIGADSIPDIHIGRIPSWDVASTRNAFGKILKYEKCPTTDNSFYNTAIHTAVFTTRDSKVQTFEPFVMTCERIRDYIMTQGVNCIRNYSAARDVNPKYWDERYGFGREISADLQRPSFWWLGNVQKINTTVDKGALYVFNCGHGVTNSWAASAFEPTDYTYVDASNLKNTSYPIFFNNSCLTGWYGSPNLYGDGISYPKSLTQTLMCHNDVGGSVGVFAASEKSSMGYGDAMMIGFFNALWPTPGFYYLVDPWNPFFTIPSKRESIPTLGKILEWGQDYQAGYYGRTDSPALHNERVFHLFGDPSMWVNTEVPTEFKNVKIDIFNSPREELENFLNINKPMAINIDDSIGVPDNSHKINVLIKMDKETNSYISLLDNKGSSKTFANNEASCFNLEPPVVLTITGHNKIPYSKTLSGESAQEKAKVYIKSLSPNPVNVGGSLTIELAGRDLKPVDIYTLFKEYSVYIFSSTGRLVLKSKIPNGMTEGEISTDGMMSGSYILMLSGDNIELDSKVFYVK